MHIYHAASGTPVVTILRPARTLKGTEVRTVIKHVTKLLMRHWPKTRFVWRGDSHYGRVEAMDWVEDNGTDYIFGLTGNTTLDALVAETADNLRFHHAISGKAKLRTFASFTYQAVWLSDGAERWHRLAARGFRGSLRVIGRSRPRRARREIESGGPPAPFEADVCGNLSPLRRETATIKVHPLSPRAL
jgi:Transposase DDE domain group 1